MGARLRLSLRHAQGAGEGRRSKDGRDILFDIDWQGTQQLEPAIRRAISSRIFILPPSMAELERRLHTRGTDSEEVIADRMRRAAERDRPLGRI